MKSIRAAARRTLAAAFARTPARTRSWIVARLPAHVVPGFMRAGARYDSGFFDRFYSRPDPWGFDRNAHERAKYQHTLEVCGAAPFDRVLEIGCGEGAFTEIVAPHAREVVAIEISPVAAARARERLARFPGVTILAAAFPNGLPAGPFDVVVASDTLVYAPVKDVQRGLAQLEASLAPGGSIVAVDYVGGKTAALLRGDEVHDLLVRSTKLAHAFGERVEISPGRMYRIDRFEKPAASVTAGGAVGRGAAVPR